MPLPFAKHHTMTVSLPSDPDNSIVIRKLPGRHLARARENSMFESVDTIKKMGGAKFQKELAEIGDPAERAKKIEEHQKDPLAAYDQQTLLYKGIVSWTYEESLKLEPAPELTDAIEMAKAGNPEGALLAVMRYMETGGLAGVIPAIDDLFEDDAKFLARAILKYAKPELFLTEDEQKAERKND